VSYSFKAIQELVWAVVVAVIVYLGTALVGLKIDDWQTWLPIIAAGAGRAVVAAILAYFAPSGTFSLK
jgi:hypothetical protein